MFFHILNLIMIINFSFSNYIHQYMIIFFCLKLFLFLDRYTLKKNERIILFLKNNIRETTYVK